MAKKKKKVKASKGYGRVVSVNSQTGKPKSKSADAKRQALPPGKRRSKKTGKIYSERRANRSDKPGKKV